MEPAKIDWKNIDSIFVQDRLYENINAPKWFDFFALDQSVDDEAWFCKPDCNHPKSAEDFLKLTPTSKFSISAEKFRTHRTDRNQRFRDKQSQTSSTSSDKPNLGEDSENQTPNLSTPLNQVRMLKGLIKSSSEKKPMSDVLQTNEAPSLKSTLSARNLFAGKDILGHISEFCTELKKMAMRSRDRENEEKLNEKGNQLREKKDAEVKIENSRKILGEVDLKVKERRPLLELAGEKSDGIGQGSAKEKQRRKKRLDDAENIPVPLNLANIKHNKDEERLLQIRTNPPSPQCFSATRLPVPTKSAPLKASSKSRLMDKGIPQEVKQHKEMMKEEETEDKNRNFGIVDGREARASDVARALDVFWFLKPCALSKLNCEI